MRFLLFIFFYFFAGIVAINSDESAFKSEYERLSEIIKSQGKLDFEQIQNIQTLIPKDAFLVKLIINNSISDLKEEDFYTLIEKDYKDYFKIRDFRVFFLEKIVNPKKQLDDLDLFYLNYLVDLREFNVNLRIFDIIKDKNVDEGFLDKLIYLILQSDNFPKADYFNFIVKNKKYLKNKDILYIIMKIFYEKNKQTDQTLKLVQKIKNIIKNPDIINWIKENESFFKDSRGGNFINDKIISKYLGASEYIDLVILENSATPKSIKYEILQKRKNIVLFPDKWYRTLRSLIREMIFRDKNDKYLHEDFYLYANKDNLPDQFEKVNDEILDLILSFKNLSFDNYINQLWLAGYISFKLERYDRSIEFFEKMRDSSKSRRETSKAYFWLAESYGKLGEETKRNENLLLASNYFLFFYGQFAIEKRNLDLKSFIKQKLKESHEISKHNHESIFHNKLFSLFLLIKDEDENAAREILKIIAKSDNVSEEVKLKILGYIKTHNRGFYQTLIKLNEPFVNLSDFYELKNVTKNPFLHALIKKESNFGKRSKSHKGARGMMQIMPQTAMLIAKNLNIKYDVYRLLVDDYYNLVLGVKYLDILLKRYNNHKILTLAAYNAGPGRVDKWVDKKGDPREATDIIDIILWTEKIPIQETRDYVKKIIESEVVYEILYEEG